MRRAARGPYLCCTSAARGCYTKAPRDRAIARSREATDQRRTQRGRSRLQRCGPTDSIAERTFALPPLCGGDRRSLGGTICPGYGREQDVKYTSARLVVRDPDYAAVLRDDLATDRQAKPHAARACGASGVGLVEALEDA